MLSRTVRSTCWSVFLALALWSCGDDPLAGKFMQGSQQPPSDRGKSQGKRADASAAELGAAGQAGSGTSGQGASGTNGSPVDAAAGGGTSAGKGAAVPPKDAAPDQDSGQLPSDAAVDADPPRAATPRSATAIEQTDFSWFGRAIALSPAALVVAGFPTQASGGPGPGVTQTLVPNTTGWTRQMPLSAAMNLTGAYDGFGLNLMISGNTLALGAGADGQDFDAPERPFGAAYVFTRDATGWTADARLRPARNWANESFGWWVAVDADTLAVAALEPGAFNPTAAQPNRLGSVYVFTRSGASWGQTAQLYASNGKGDDHFGDSLAISGDTLVVGAWGEDSRGTGINGDMTNTLSFARAGDLPGVGAAYVFVLRNGVWTQDTYLKASDAQDLNFFGRSVAFDGHTLVVGAPGRWLHGHNDPSDYSGRSAGGVYVFERAASGWSQTAILEASNTAAGDGFGSSVALAGNRLVVGAPNEASAAVGIDGDQTDDSAMGSGAAYLFERRDGTWQQVAYLKPTLARAHGEFGASVALDAQRVAVGAPASSAGQGVVYVFE